MLHKVTCQTILRMENTFSHVFCPFFLSPSYLHKLIPFRPRLHLMALQRPSNVGPSSNQRNERKQTVVTPLYFGSGLSTDTIIE